MKLQIVTFWCLMFLVLNGCVPSNPQNQINQSKNSSINWQEIGPGISYDSVTVTTTNNQEKNLIIVKISPTKNIFHIYQNTNFDQSKTVETIQKETHALISVNGGFYTEDFKPTGLLLENGKILTPYQSAKLTNGIFAITTENEPLLIKKTKLENPQKYLFAIQNGPILLDEKSQIALTEDNGKPASRTAIGIDKDNNIIIIILKQSLFQNNNQILLTEFARLLKENETLKPLGLHSVLNLDGGPSSGIMIGDKYFAEFQKVQNIIWVGGK